MMSCSSDDKTSLIEVKDDSIAKTNEGYLHFNSQATFDSYMNQLKAIKEGVATKSTDLPSVKGFKSITALKSEIKSMQTRSDDDEEIGSKDEYNLSRSENIIQSELLMNVLDTTLRISIADKYYKITDNGTFSGSMADKAEIDTIIAHYANYESLFSKIDSSTYSYKGITFEKTEHIQNVESIPEGVITKSITDFASTKVQQLGLDSYKVGLSNWFIFGFDHSETKNFDSTHRVKFSIYSHNFIFFKQTGMKVGLERRKKFLFVKYWVYDDAQDRLVGFNQLETKVTTAFNVPIYPIQSNARAKISANIAQYFVNVGLAGVGADPFLGELTENVPCWCVDVLGISNSVSEKIYSASFEAVMNSIRNVSKSTLSKALNKLIPNEDPIQELHYPYANNIISNYVGEAKFGSGEGKPIVFDRSFGITFSLGNSFSIKPFSPETFSIRKLDVYGAVKYNNRWLGVRFIKD